MENSLDSFEKLTEVLKGVFKGWTIIQDKIELISKYIDMLIVTMLVTWI